MNKETVGTLASLVGLWIAGFGIALATGDRFMAVLTVGATLGIVAHACVMRLAKILPLALLFPSSAKAFFIFAALAVGLAVGLIGWGAIKLWSSLMTVERIVGERQEEARVTISRPLEVAASPELEAQGDSVYLSAGTWRVLSPKPGLTLWYLDGQSIEFSTNCVDWIPAPDVAPEGPMGFWRVR